MAAAGSSGVERKRGAKVTRFTTGELEEFELLMQGIPNFDKRRIKQDAANGDCYRCDQFDRETRKCRFSFCLFDDFPYTTNSH